MANISSTAVKQPKSLMRWTWIFILLFFALSVFNILFAVSALICMLMPIGFSLAGKGRRSCSHYCPRGSFLGNFLGKINIGKTMPHFMKSRYFKHALTLFMFFQLGLLSFLAGGGIYGVASALFKMVLITTIAGIILGILYTPRSWCQICPMGHCSGMIKEAKDKKIRCKR